MATLEEIEAALRKADAAGNVEDARALAAAYRAQQAEESSPAYQDALAAGSQASQRFAAYSPPGGPSLADRGQSFAQGVIEGLPIGGPWLADRRVDLDAALAALPGGMTPEQVREQAAERKAYLEQHAGNERVAGNIAGAVLPLTVAGLGAPATIGRALGMTGGLGSQVTMGALSGIGIGGADTLARGGSMEDAGKMALLSGGVGGFAPLAMKGIGAAWNALTRQGVPKASSNIAQAMADDGIEAANIPAMLAERGPGAAVMDLGQNLQTLAGGIASVRGPAQKVLRDTITSRAKAAPARVAADVARTIGKGQEVGALTEQIIAAQKAAADPLYAAVRDVPIPLEGNIKFVAQTPLGKSAFQKAVRLAANDGIRPEGLTVGLLDYAKKALDDVAGSAKRAGENNAARQAVTMAKLLASEADKLVPAYKQAREAFAGPAQVLDAIEAGQGTFKANMSPADMGRLMAEMTASEKDAFLQGAQTAVADLLGNSANDVAAVRALLRKPYNEAKLRVLIGDEATDDLLRSMDRELIFGKTANAVEGNSETARRTAAQSMVNPEMATIQRPQDWIGLVFAAIDKARGAFRANAQPKVNRQMAEMLTSGSLSPELLAQLARSQKAPAPLPVAPASLPLLPGQTPGQDFGNRPPLRIVVDGANPI